MIKYKTGYGADKIEPVEVLRETPAFVYVACKPRPGKKVEERREGKQSEWAQYHDTWDAAKAYLTKNAQADVTAARRRLELANAKLGNIKGMKPPKELP